MTEKERIALTKIKEVEKEFKLRSTRRAPLSGEEKLPPISAMQIDKNQLKELEVLNSKEAKVAELDTPIPAKDYDKREKAGKKTSQKISEETTRD